MQIPLFRGRWLPEPHPAPETASRVWLCSRQNKAKVNVNQPQLAWIANYIWGIADDVLRDLYVRGKYRDVILPMTVLRRLDAVLEPPKPAVLEMKATLDRAGILNQDQALRQASGQAFYNTSAFTMRD